MCNIVHTTTKRINPETTHINQNTHDLNLSSSLGYIHSYSLVDLLLDHLKLMWMRESLFSVLNNNTLISVSAELDVIVWTYGLHGILICIFFLKRCQWTFICVKYDPTTKRNIRTAKVHTIWHIWIHSCCIDLYWNGTNLDQTVVFTNAAIKKSFCYTGIGWFVHERQNHFECKISRGYAFVNQDHNADEGKFREKSSNMDQYQNRYSITLYICHL